MSDFLKKYSFLLFLIILSAIPIIDTQTNQFGAILTLLEYLAIFFFIIRGNYYYAFCAFLVAVSVTIEFDAFVNEDMASKRITFFRVPIAGNFLFQGTIILITFNLIRTYGINFEDIVQKFYKYLKVLLISGVVTIIISMLLNDNNIMTSKLYPTAPITTIFSFLALCSLFIATFIIIQIDDYRDKLESLIKYLLIAIGITSAILPFQGYTGVYGSTDGILLASQAVAFTPMLILFLKEEAYIDNKILYIFVTSLIIVISSIFPLNIGSKWYLIILLLVSALLIQYTHIKSIWLIISLAVGGLFLLSAFSDTILAFSTGSDFGNAKMNQSLNSISIFKYDSFDQWFANLDNSPAYRVDELLNTAEEFIHKPFYLLFGKGFAGTTLHYTTYIDWIHDSYNFTDEQKQLGAYYAMHETSAVLFLRHGLVGIVFFFYFLFQLIKRIPITPWASIALIWFVFYWSYGYSFWVGAVAMAMALSYPTEDGKEYDIYGLD